MRYTRESNTKCIVPWKKKYLFCVYIRGKYSEMSFEFWAEDHFDEWKENGLKVTQVLNTIPMWIEEFGLTKIWCWLQDHYIIPLE